jgi:hypothetical protein
MTSRRKQQHQAEQIKSNQIKSNQNRIKQSTAVFVQTHTTQTLTHIQH